MPYKSLAQERYFNSNRAKLESQGVNVGEWNRASKGKKLPMKKNNKKESKKEEKKEMMNKPVKKMMKAHHSRKDSRAKLNTLAEKNFFGSRRSG